MRNIAQQRAVYNYRPIRGVFEMKIAKFNKIKLVGCGMTFFSTFARLKVFIAMKQEF